MRRDQMKVNLRSTAEDDILLCYCLFVSSIVLQCCVLCPSFVRSLSVGRAGTSNLLPV